MYKYRTVPLKKFDAKGGEIMIEKFNIFSHFQFLYFYLKNFKGKKN